MADAEHFITLALESWRRFSADFGEKMQPYGLTVEQAMMIREIGIHIEDDPMTTRQRAALRAMAARLRSECAAILAANAEDLEAATATVEALSEEDLEALKNIVSKMKNGYVQP